ncbi:HpcH/HpaI aldolase family protein [Streptomyces purpurogeneiscleroticus]|uniref:HpcH/HpaI aldolase family protein n=1 Tax=Streptomyces purpurogeneiscleroticus TaxID=68259 RepID=UPI001CBB1A76|nr:aldolase/citrate lyase family protein [Streptomyces purpurogeneiscleroticus]MBZ4019067.1 2-dehydro-3-deoxyglucarate aldolase [Streptomyces purpurogeneiscleroticus]
MTARPEGRRSLKQRLAAGERLYGALLRLPSETLVEMAGVAGLDYVVIDCEHGPADTTALQHHLTAAAAQGIDVLVRVGTAEPALALRCLDLGAAGLIHPHIDSAADARRAVAADRYPPLGERGFATYSRAGRFGTVTAAEHLAASEETLVVAMIETARACAAAAEIVATEGIDAVLVGPADLTVDCGFPGKEAIDKLIAATHGTAHDAGRAVMSIVPDTAGARAAEQAGAQLVLYNMAHVLMDTFRALTAPRAEPAQRHI